MADHKHIDEITREERAARLKERIYLTFAALAVVLTLDYPDALESMKVLAITMLGLVMALFVAEVVSHIVVHEGFPSRAEFMQVCRTTFGAMSAMTIPFAFLTASWLTDWSVESALQWSMWWLLISLIAIGYLAVRRLSITPLQKLVVLGAEAGLGAIVIALKLLAH